MILELVNSFLDRPGNIGIRTARILRELASRPHPEALCISRGGTVDVAGVRCVGMGPLGHLPRLLNALRIFLFPGFNHRILDIRLFEWFAALALTRYRNGRPPAVAHIWEYAPRLMADLRRRRIPVILDVPIAPTAYAERLWRERRCGHLMMDPRQIRLESEAFGQADLLLVPSGFVAEELKRIGVPESRIRVVPFGVDTADADERQAAKAGSRGMHWVMLGNVNYRKGVKELLDAWRDPAFADDTLHLCGRVNPEVGDALKGAGSNVLTPGFVDPRDYLRRCHVFVMPSWMEGSSKAVYEAMAMGLPAIVSRSTGSVVRDGIDGFVIEAGDVAALKESMLRFRRDPALVDAMGRNAMERAREYSWERYASSVAAVYEEFISRGESLPKKSHA